MPSCWKLAWCFCSDPGRRPKISSPVHLLLKVNDDRNNNNNPKGVGAFSRCAVATLIVNRFSRATTHVNNENQEVIEGSFCATIIFIICAHFSPGISSTQSRALIAVYVQVCSPHYYFFFEYKGMRTGLACVIVRVERELSQHKVIPWLFFFSL